MLRAPEIIAKRFSDKDRKVLKDLNFLHFSTRDYETREILSLLFGEALYILYKNKEKSFHKVIKTLLKEEGISL